LANCSWNTFKVGGSPITMATSGQSTPATESVTAIAVLNPNGVSNSVNILINNKSEYVLNMPVALSGSVAITGATISELTATSIPGGDNALSGLGAAIQGASIAYIEQDGVWSWAISDPTSPSTQYPFGAPYNLSVHCSPSENYLSGVYVPAYSAVLINVTYTGTLT